MGGRGNKYSFEIMKLVIYYRCVNNSLLCVPFDKIKFYNHHNKIHFIIEEPFQNSINCLDVIISVNKN